VHVLLATDGSLTSDHLGSVCKANLHRWRNRWMIEITHITPVIPVPDADYSGGRTMQDLPYIRHGTDDVSMRHVSMKQPWPSLCT